MAPRLYVWRPHTPTLKAACCQRQLDTLMLDTCSIRFLRTLPMHHPTLQQVCEGAVCTKDGGVAVLSLRV